MAIVRFVQSYPSLTGLAKDTQTNTLYFESGLSETAIQAAIWGQWTTFLAVMDANMTNKVFSNQWPAEFFDMSDPEPRVPIGSATYGATLGTVESLPLETSMCVSFSGPVVSGVNQARRRGRIYLPTFITGNVQAVSGRVQWLPALVTQFANAFSAFANALLDLPTPVFLCVYSPTTHAGGATLFDSLTTVTQGWIDNEPDTQRRRGMDGGTKTAFTVAP